MNNKEFNIDTADLSANMILEASAGTGKTYSLEHLFVRYILETGISVKEILVVTFTEKAASELKKRIKALIRKELSEMETEACEGALNLNSGKQEKYTVLKQALYDFPEAPVFTIHGFCQNCLSGFPVESGLPFDFKIMESDAVYRETVLDYFRSLEVENNDEYISFRSGKSSFDACTEFFISLLKKDSINSNVLIYPDKDLIQQYRNMKADFAEGRGGLRIILDQINNLNPDTALIESICTKVKPGIRKNTFSLLSSVMEELCSSSSLSDFFSDKFADNYKNIRKLTVSWMEANKKDLLKLDDRELEFCSALESLLELPDDFTFDEKKRRGKKPGSFPYHDIAASSFILDTLYKLNVNLYLNKMKISGLDFPDLIKIMHSAVTDFSSFKSAALRRELERKYKIVMIDEFQDTDNLQWEIFSSLFSGSGRKIVLIGDPKQSIYRFRGADIEVYFKALEEVKDKSVKYMLGTNYRSEKRVVEALNTVFKEVFAFTSGGGHSIDFSPVNYTENKDALLEKGGVEFLAVENEEQLKADEVLETVENIFALEIKNLLESGNVTASDICILLESNDNCRDMYDLLVSLNIPAVYDGETDLFKSNEIHYILDFLTAVAQPFDRGYLIKTLISPLFDFKMTDMPSREDDILFEKISSVFLKWKDLTDKGSFSAVFDEIISSENIFPDLQNNDKNPWLIRRITEIGGERKITDFNHIGELLIFRNRTGRDNCTELASYLKSVIDGAENEEERITRLERDDKAVRIMTMHKSKGLEFPIVFFGGGMKGGDLPTKRENYYEYAGKGRRYIDLVRKSENKYLHYYEQWEERKRLYYVAFTRAEQKLYLPLFRYSNLNYLTSLYGCMVFKELKNTLYGSGIEPVIPLAGMNAPKDMKASDMTDIISENIYNLVKDKFNDGKLFNINSDVFRQVCEKGISPLTDSSGNKDKISSERSGELVFTEASVGNVKNISVVSYSSLVRDADHSGLHENAAVIPGINSPADDEVKYEKTVSLNSDFLSENSLSAEDYFGPAENMGTSASDTAGVEDAAASLSASSGTAVSAAAETDSAVDTEEKDVLKGPAFGNLMHTLLEKADYEKILSFKSYKEIISDKDILLLIESTAKQFLSHDRISSSVMFIAELLYSTLAGRFSLPDNKGTLTVGEISGSRRYHELEFLLKVKEGSGSSLLNLPYLNLKEGYIKGFIDLIFIHDNLYYIADWKTNYLGSRKEDYTEAAVKQAMDEHNYLLQMKLYMTALARILSVREDISLAEAAGKTGGCYYFFLRGMDSRKADSGVYFSAPDIDEIITFSDTFFEDSQ